MNKQLFLLLNLALFFSATGPKAFAIQCDNYLVKLTTSQKQIFNYLQGHLHFENSATLEDLGNLETALSATDTFLEPNCDRAFEEVLKETPPVTVKSEWVHGISVYDNGESNLILENLRKGLAEKIENKSGLRKVDFSNAFKEFKNLRQLELNQTFAAIGGLEAARSKIASSTNPAIKAARDAMKKAEFAIRSKPTHRYNVHAAGLQPFGSINGYNFRLDLETRLMGLDSKLAEPINFPTAKYGYLRIGHYSEPTKLSLNQYGEDVYILKKNQIVNSTTFTFSDSLVYEGIPSWIHRFTPASEEDLLALSIVHSDQAGQSMIGAFEGHVDPTLYQRAVPGIIPELSKTTIINDIDRFYIELQFWLPKDQPNIPLEMVEAFEFQKGNPPSGLFLEDLKKNHIVIREIQPNGRRKVWKPT